MCLPRLYDFGDKIGGIVPPRPGPEGRRLKSDPRNHLCRTRWRSGSMLDLRKRELHAAYSDRGIAIAMIRCDFLSRGSANCKRSVNGLCWDIRVVDQNVGRCWRRRRMHRRCIGCEENTRLGSSPRIQPQLRSIRRFNKPKHPHLLVRPGSHLPAPAVRFSTARRARPSQCWPPLRRPPAGLGIDRPSTVLRLQEAVTIIGMVLLEVFVSCGSDRCPSGPRPAPSWRRGSVARPMLAAR
jgi:hypothetical protein